jgi:hypothetical protein
MSINLIKKLDVTNRVAHVLLREQLIYALELVEIDNYAVDLPNTRVVAAGVNGVCNSTTPQTFTASGFNATMVGKYLVLYDTAPTNKGIHKIIGVPNSTTLLLQGGLYGSSLTTDTSVAYRVIDPTLNTGSTEFTIQGGTGTSPVWQARFFIHPSDTKTIRMELGPNGGFVGGNRTAMGDTISGTAPTMTLTDAGAVFYTTDSGRYVTISGATTPANNGTFLITSAPSSTVINYTNAGGVAEAFPGSWSISGRWTSSVLTNRAISADPAFDRWYFKLENTNIIAWTENVAGNGVYNIAYAGSGATKRPAVDSNFAVLAGGVSPTFLTALASTGAGSGAQVDYKAIVYGDSSTNNNFTGLPSSTYDLRNDSTDIPVGCEAVGFIEDDRGILQGLQWISSLIPYKSFVDNGRHLLSLGSGIAVEWDGSLAR